MKKIDIDLDIFEEINSSKNTIEENKNIYKNNTLKKDKKSIDPSKAFNTKPLKIAGEIFSKRETGKIFPIKNKSTKMIKKRVIDKSYDTYDKDKTKKVKYNECQSGDSTDFTKRSAIVSRGDKYKNRNDKIKNGKDKNFINSNTNSELLSRKSKQDKKENNKATNNNTQDKESKSTNTAQNKENKSTNNAQNKENKSTNNAQNKENKSTNNAQNKESKSTNNAQNKENKSTNNAQNKESKSTNNAQNKEKKSTNNDSRNREKKSTNSDTQDKNKVSKTNITNTTDDCILFMKGFPFECTYNDISDWLIKQIHKNPILSQIIKEYRNIPEINTRMKTQDDSGYDKISQYNKKSIYFKNPEKERALLKVGIKEVRLVLNLKQKPKGYIFVTCITDTLAKTILRIHNEGKIIINERKSNKNIDIKNTNKLLSKIVDFSIYAGIPLQLYKEYEINIESATNTKQKQKLADLFYNQKRSLQETAQSAQNSQKVYTQNKQNNSKHNTIV